MLKENLKNLKKDLMKYADAHFGLSNKYEFDLILGQPYSGETYFHPTTKRMEISPRNFFIFKENNEIKINVCTAIETLFHELIGHGRHEHNSSKLPLTLQSNAINNSNIIAGVHKEGVAQITKEHAIKFMKIHKKKYKIEDDYIKQIELSTIGDYAGNFKILYNYLKAKKKEKPSLNIEKEFTKITNNYGLFLLFDALQDSSIGCIAQAKYPVGYERMNALLENLKKDLGEKNFNKNDKIINQAISTGVWNIDVLPKFVKLYLKETGVTK